MWHENVYEDEYVEDVVEIIDECFSEDREIPEDELIEYSNSDVLRADFYHLHKAIYNNNYGKFVTLISNPKVFEMFDEYETYCSSLIYGIDLIFIKDRWEMLSVLLEKGYDINTPTEKINNMAIYNSLDCLVVSVPYINNFEVETRDGKTPLMISIENLQIEFFEALLDYGADVNNYTEYDPQTPLIFAVKEYEKYRDPETLEFIKILLERGANKNMPDYTGASARFYAKSSETKNLLR